MDNPIKRVIKIFLSTILIITTVYPNFILSAPVTLNFQINTSLGDTTMGSISNNSGRNVVNSGSIDTTGVLGPGSHNSNDEWSGAVRFTNVNIPQGSTITNATLSLRPNTTWCPGGITVRFHVSTEASDNAGALTSSSGDLNISNRPRSSADAGPWTQSCINTSTLETLNVTNIVQELINRVGWVSGNAMVILIDTHADTTQVEWQAYESYDTNASEAPRLDITYDDGASSGPKVRIRSGIRIRGLVRFR